MLEIKPCKPLCYLSYEYYDMIDKDVVIVSFSSVPAQFVSLKGLKSSRNQTEILYNKVKKNLRQKNKFQFG